MPKGVKLPDIPIGTRFFNWTVISSAFSKLAGPNGSKRKYYTCECKCGEISDIRASCLLFQSTGYCKYCHLKDMCNSNADPGFIHPIHAIRKKISHDKNHFLTKVTVPKNIKMTPEQLAQSLRLSV